MGEIFWDSKRSAEALSISLSNFNQLRKSDPAFPEPVRVSSRRVAFRPSEILAWAEGRPRGGLDEPEQLKSWRERGAS